MFVSRQTAPVAESIRKGPKIIITINRPKSQNQTSHPANVGIPQLSTFHFDLSTLTMPTQAQIKPPIPMILPAYKAALLMSRSLYLCRESSTTVEDPLQITYFLCKTNPISTEAKTNLTPYTKKVYENFISPRTMKNEPKTNPIQTQSSYGQIQCNPLCHKGLRQ